MTPVSGPPLGWGRSLLFASGDFACNLYWQSITFYLMFFYTDVLRLDPATAGMITLVASVWDGLAGLAVGLLADRAHPQTFVRRCAVPLAASFILLYLVLPLQGAALAGFALAAHMAFRTLYVAVNVPYAAMTVGVAPHSADRSRIAGLRMILGGAAALIVAVTTQACVARAGAGGYAAAAFLFGLAGTAFLLAVGSMPVRSRTMSSPSSSLQFGAVLRLMTANRAFVWLNLAICGGVAAMAVLTRSVPYYFTYLVGDAAAGSAALAMMGAAGVVAIPVWMACAARFGHRLQWQASAWLAAAALSILLVLRPAAALPAQILLTMFYAGAQGLFFGFWSIIPDVVERGGAIGEPRRDVLLFAVAALLQKVTTGLAVALFGGALSSIGYVAGAAQSPAVLAGLAYLSAGLPLAAIMLAAAAMLRFPRLRSAGSEVAGA